jgi:hypothetical protein
MRRLFFVPLTAALVLGRGVPARAETCPEIPDTEAGLRRSMAKEWFAKAEEAEANGDKPGAVRRYSCSLNLTPHPSTAYNLGTVAEKSGDWSMAIEGFRAYLKLSPEAADRPTIEARVVALEAKLAELRKDLAPKEAAPGEAASVPAAIPASTPPVLLAPPSPAPSDEAPHGHHVGGWISLATAVATAGGGVALNLIARSKMNQCARMWMETMADSALDRCDEAKPYAYGSYALFGVGGALGATGLLLLLLPSGGAEAPAPASAPAVPPTSDVSFAATPGGAAATLSGRF